MKITPKELRRYADDYEANGIRASSSTGRIIAETYRAHASALEERQELIEALRPFAALLQDHHDRLPDSQPIFGINSATIYLGQIRAVSALLARLDK